MGYLSLNTTSSLLCQDLNCQEQCPSRPALMPKMGSASSRLDGRAFIVVRAPLSSHPPFSNRIPSPEQCGREDIHTDKRAWFGVWPAGVLPPQYAPRAPVSAPFITSQSPAPRRAKERCGTPNCAGFTAMGCPYRRCASHCRKAGGCNKHKVPNTQQARSFNLPASPRLPSSSPQLPLSANQPLAVSEYQNVTTSEEDALMAAIEALRLDAENTLPPSGSTSYSSSSRIPASTMAGSSTSDPSPTLSRRPKISSQLGGAWLELLDRDAQDEVQKENLRLAKAEAAAEVKKSVDLLWYDQVCVGRLTSCPQALIISCF